MKIAVVGLGIVGLSAAMGLQEAGHAVTGFERFGLLHDRGSSHGDTRIFRRYPFEGGDYLRLADIAVDGWRRWNAQSGQRLLVESGGIYAGPPGNDMLPAIEAQGATPRRMTPAALHEKYHGLFAVPEDWDAMEIDGDGWLQPDATRTFLARRIVENGGTLHFNAKVDDLNALAKDYDAVVVAAGGWTGALLPQLSPLLKTERRVMGWYRAAGPVANLPVFRLGVDFYGMPTPDGLVKIGMNDHFREKADMEVPVAPAARDADFIEQARARFAPGLQPGAVKTASCVYTMTPDQDFIVDSLPGRDNVLVMACCSGHGFKYGPAYGTLAADYFAGRKLPARFSISRFSS